MKKRLYMIIALLYCGSVISGCSMSQESMSGDDKDNNNVKVEKTVDDNKKQEEKNEQEQQVYDIYTAKIKDCTEQTSPSDFFPENSDYKEIKKEEVKTGEDKNKMWRDSKNNYLLCGYGRICYSSRNYEYVYSNLLYDDNGAFRNNFNKILADGKVNGISKEKAIEKMRDIVKSNGIAADNAVAYPLTVKNLTKLSKMFMSDKEYKKYMEDKTNEPLKRKFYKKDEAYLVVMNVKADDKILCDKEYHYGKRAYSGSFCFGIVSTSGVEFFDAEGIYEKLSKDKDNITILSEKQAMDKLNQRFADIISEKVKCNSLSTTYITVKEKKNDNSYAVIPIYLFDVTQEVNHKKSGKKTKVTYENTLFLDAETGEWLE